MKFLLDIYTWPAMCGVDCKCRSSYHETPEEAISHLEAQTESYAYAVLQRKNEAGYAPCDWNGQFLISQKTPWPHRMGENGMHPAVIALRKDWENLISLIRDQYDGSRGMIHIASELLSERHPEIKGYAEPLAWEAAQK